MADSQKINRPGLLSFRRAFDSAVGTKPSTWAGDIL